MSREPGLGVLRVKAVWLGAVVGPAFVSAAEGNRVEPGTSSYPQRFEVSSLNTLQRSSTTTTSELDFYRGR